MEGESAQPTAPMFGETPPELVAMMRSTHSTRTFVSKSVHMPVPLPPSKIMLSNASGPSSK